MEGARKNGALSAKFAFEYCSEIRSPNRMLVFWGSV